MPFREALWQQLTGAGLVTGALPVAAPAGGPWYVRAMLGIAGWIGALFLLGFVGAALAFVFRDESAGVAVGLIFCVAAYAIFRAARHNDFLQQFGLAVSLAGQVLFAIGIHRSFRSDPTGFALMIAGFEAVLALSLANPVHRVWATWIAMISLAYGMGRLGLFGVAPALAAAGLAAIWLNESLWASRGSVWRPVGHGLALSLINIEAMLFFGHAIDLWPHRAAAAKLPLWAGAAVIGALWLFVAYRMLDRSGVAATSRVGLATLIAVAVTAAVTRDAHGVTAALLVMTLAFAAGARALTGLGIVALLASLSYYYYALHMTLLAKSGVLAAIGVALITLWFGIRLLAPPGLAAREADRA